MRLVPYLSFKGDCEAAFTFYERCLGGSMGEIFRYAGSPLADQAPPDWSGKVMHTSFMLDGVTLNGADVAPEHYQEPRGFQLSLQLTNAADAERIFRELGAGGRVVMPLEKTFWAARFGMVIDRFGIPWLINCEASAQSE
jgi:PhnB protein